MGKGEGDIRGGQTKEGGKKCKRGEKKKRKRVIEKNWDLVGIEPMPGLKV